ncbi:hypothetical protein G9P44_002814 [Scheffersomyces stipitis]|nr:hypothetical protein G9P44_002814 [Scheffersomyces stipitis]
MNMLKKEANKADLRMSEDNITHRSEATEVHVSEEEKSEEEPSEENKYLTGIPLILCTISIILSIFLTAIDQTVVITALAGIEEAFGGASQIGWSTAGYVLPMAVLALFWGRFGLVMGRKSSVLISIFFFEVGSLICALSKSMGMFIGGRVITGIGAGGIQTNVFMISSEITPLNQRGIIIAFVTMSLIPAAVIGPVIGGLFTSSKTLTWRWCFYINLPFGGVAALFLSLLYKPKNDKSRFIWNWNKTIFKRLVNTFDLVGVLLVGISLVLFLVGCSLGGTGLNGFNKPVTICFTIIGGVLFLCFIYYEFYCYKVNQEMHYYPMLPKELIFKRQVLAPGLIMLLSNMVFNGSSMYISIYFENLLGNSPSRTGVHLLPMILPTILTTMISGLICSKVGIVKPVLIFGSICGVISSGLITMLNYHSSDGEKIGFLFLVGFSFGFFNQASMIAAQLSVSEDQTDYTLIITSFTAFMRSFGASLGGIVLTSIYSNTVNKELQKYPQFREETVDQILKNGSLQGFDQHEASILINALSIGLKWVFHSILILSVSCLFISFTTSNARVPQKKKEDTDIVEA